MDFASSTVTDTAKDSVLPTADPYPRNATTLTLTLVDEDGRIPKKGLGYKQRSTTTRGLRKLLRVVEPMLNYVL